MDGQTIFAILVGVALACFSLVMVGYSFFRNRDPQQESPPAIATSGDDSIGVDSLLDSIDTLELEHQLGNVPDEQYQQQLHAYRQQIATAVRQQLEHGEASPELVLEHEVLRARSAVAESWRSCPQCDAPLPVSLNGDFGRPSCPHCNAVLSTAPSEGNAADSLPTSLRNADSV